MTAESITVADLRRIAGRWILVALWLHVLIVPAVGLALGASILVPTAVAACAVAVATWAYAADKDGAAFRAIVSVAAMTLVAILVFKLAGHPWQIDAHMYFFAALAVLAAFCDWRALLARGGYGGWASSRPELRASGRCLPRRRRSRARGPSCGDPDRRDRGALLARR